MTLVHILYRSNRIGMTVILTVLTVLKFEIIPLMPNIDVLGLTVGMSGTGVVNCS